MPDENLLDLTDEEIRHVADLIREACATGPEEVVKTLYLAGLLKFGDYGDRAHLRAAWGAMSACLITLSRHEEPDANWLAQVPSAHRTYLLGHAATHRQNAEMGRRLRLAQEPLAPLVHGRATAEKDALYRVIQVLRGDVRDVDVQANAAAVA
jgi:hypothetical protein